MNTYKASDSYLNWIKQRSVQMCLRWLILNTSENDWVVTGGVAVSHYLKEKGYPQLPVNDIDIVIRGLKFRYLKKQILEKMWIGFKNKEYLCLLWKPLPRQERVKVDVFTDAFPFKDEIVYVLSSGINIPIVSLERLVAKLIYDCSQIEKGTAIDPKHFEFVELLQPYADTGKLNKSWERHFQKQALVPVDVAWKNAQKYSETHSELLVSSPFAKSRGIIRSVWWIVKFGLLTLLLRTFNVGEWDEIY